MMPTPIPDEEVPEGWARKVLSPPDGDLTSDFIRAAEAIIGAVEGRGIVFAFRMVPEPGDLERLAAGEPIWLTLWGGVPPFGIGYPFG